MSKRNCVFTGKPSDFKLKMNSSEDDLKNWAKDVPCCKEYVKSADLLHRALNEHEMRLVELFYEQEVAKLRVSNIDAQMFEIRLKKASMPRMPSIPSSPMIVIDEPDGPLSPECWETELKPTLSEEAAFIKETSKEVDKAVKRIAKDIHKNMEPTKILTEEPEDVKVEKKIVKKQTLWD